MASKPGEIEGSAIKRAFVTGDDEVTVETVSGKSVVLRIEALVLDWVRLKRLSDKKEPQ